MLHCHFHYISINRNTLALSLNHSFTFFSPPQTSLLLSPTRMHMHPDTHFSYYVIQLWDISKVQSLCIVETRSTSVWVAGVSEGPLRRLFHLNSLYLALSVLRLWLSWAWRKHHNYCAGVHTHVWFISIFIMFPTTFTSISLEAIRQKGLHKLVLHFTQCYKQLFSLAFEEGFFFVQLYTIACIHLEGASIQNNFTTDLESRTGIVLGLMSSARICYSRCSR